jgi:N6-adenosine-specific RNA methylase IME4
MTPDEVNRRHEEQIRLLDAGQRHKSTDDYETTVLRDAIASAEVELEILSRQSKEAWQQYRKLDQQQTAKAEELKELRRKLGGRR